ncbi:hypothetical protein U9M48_027720 [Paspalum notatum var. saurae]|uniref:Uncharacterized protein n=1 Tax=Paspalum notatum var. saurae TaxID=547442 RepID=A0AAQ3TXS2_PASNO
MAAPSHSYTPPHHQNMKTECSYHKEYDPLLHSLIHALKDAMEVASLLLPLLSMVWRPWRTPPDDPRCRGKAAALWDRVRSGITALMSPMSSLLPSTAWAPNVKLKNPWHEVSPRTLKFARTYTHSYLDGMRAPEKKAYDKWREVNIQDSSLFFKCEEELYKTNASIILLRGVDPN